VYLTAFTGNPLAYLNPNKGRATTTILAGADPMSLNNGRVVNKLSTLKKNVNSERDKQTTAAATYLDNDEEDQDTLSSKGL